jgi:hypothetical protein
MSIRKQFSVFTEIIIFNIDLNILNHSFVNIKFLALVRNAGGGELDVRD